MSALQTASCPLPVEAGSLPARVLKKLFFCFLFFQCSHLSVSLGFSQLGFFFTPFLRPPSPHLAAPTSSKTTGRGRKNNPDGGKMLLFKTSFPGRGGVSNKLRLRSSTRAGWPRWSSIYPSLTTGGTGKYPMEVQAFEEVIPVFICKHRHHQHSR